MKILVPSTKFKKKIKKAPKEIVGAFKKKIVIFEEDEFAEVLNNHKLHGRFDGCRSINITGDWRMVYENKGDNNFLLVDIGTHSELYE